MKNGVVLLAVVLLSLILCVHAEEKKTFDQKVTELEMQLQKVSGEKKANALNELSSLFSYKDPARSAEFARRAAAKTGTVAVK